MITYKSSRINGRLLVYLDGKRVGTILKVSDSTLTHGYGWQYYPNSAASGGEVFNTLSECQRSLESA